MTTPNLLQAIMQVCALSQADTKRLNITTLGVLLAAKEAHDKGLKATMSDLCRKLSVTSAAMTGARDRLAAMGYIQDGPGIDRRSICVALTPDGEALVAQIAVRIAPIEGDQP